LQLLKTILPEFLTDDLIDSNIIRFSYLYKSYIMPKVFKLQT